MELNRYDIVIIGAGTAGLCAAIYGARAGKKVLVLEEKLYGGQITSSPEVENYPGIKKISGSEFATTLYEQAFGLGAEIKMEQAQSIDADKMTVKTTAQPYAARTIILATGAKNRLLGLKQEETLIGRGVSYCATCDGAFFKQKTVAVVGGGNTALEDAGFLAEYCKQVFLIHRRDAFRGEERLAEALRKKKNVTILFNRTVTQLKGATQLEGVEVTSSIDGARQWLALDGLFVAIGQIPENSSFSPPVKLDAAGYIIAGEDCKTNVPGIFAAGDCRTKGVRQLSTAAGDGTVAALAACDYLLKG